MRCRLSVRSLRGAALSALLVTAVGACSAATDLGGEPGAAQDEDAQSKHHRDMASPSHDQASTDAGPVAANPPPASCDQRSAGKTAIQALVRISDYQGLIKGSNGDHEIAYGTLIDTVWVYDRSLLDTSHVQLAMNVASAIDAAGLPREIRLAVGQTVEVEGEWIPAKTANAHDAGGPAAVLHYTHAPCGYVRINGAVYR